MPGSNVHENRIEMGRQTRRCSRQTQQTEWKELHEYCDRIDRRGAANARTKSEKPESSTSPAHPLPGPGPSSLKAATRRPHFQAAQTKAENARELNPEENDKRSSPRWTTTQLLSLRGCPDAAGQRAVCP